MPRNSLGLGHRQQTTEMVSQPGEVTWRASKRASVSAREQGEALGVRTATGARASAVARRARPIDAQTRRACPVRPEEEDGQQGQLTCGSRQRKMECWSGLVGPPGDGPVGVGSWAALEGSGGSGWLARLVRIGFEIELVYISLSRV
jgi:hypothetical protein